MNLMKDLASYGLNSKERSAALEEFCIFGNSTKADLKSLGSLEGARHAAESLRSPDPGVVARSLCLASLLCAGNEA